MTARPRRLFRPLAAFASALLLCPLAPAQAGSITVKFGPDDGAAAEYTEVNVALFPISNTAAGAVTKATTFRSTDKSFEKTFDKLPPGQTVLQTVLTAAAPTGFRRFNAYV